MYLGNTIQNSNSLQGNASVNFVTLYNTIPYLKKVNQGSQQNNNRNRGPKTANDNKRGSKEQDDENTTAKDFPYKQNSGTTALSTQMTVFNLAFYPEERGSVADDGFLVQIANRSSFFFSIFAAFKTNL